MVIRKAFWQVLIGLWLSVGAATTVFGAGDRPNILVCFADDWGRYASAYREGENDQTPNSVLSTPNIDRVAREGVLFNNAFVNAPSCTPCRSSLLSGQFFWRTGRGAILRGAVWDQNIPSYPLILKEHGYHIGHTYKVWSPGTPANAPYGAAATAYNQAGNKFGQFSELVSQSDDPTAAKQMLLDEVRGNFRAFMKDRGENQPFCYWFGPTNCHRVWAQGSGKQIWGLNPDDLRGKLPPYLPNNEVVREDFCDYLGEVQAFDAAVGALRAELEQLGELDNTLIVISGDHGIPGFPRGKCNLYDLGTRVTLAVRWGNAIPAGRRVDDFVCLPDLAPTFLDVAGIAPPEVMTAKSLRPVLVSQESGLVDPARDFVIVGRERHVDRARTDFLPYPQRAIHTPDFLYIRNFQPDRWPMGTATGFGLPDGPLPGYEELRDETYAAFADMDASPTKAWLITHRNDPGMATFFDIAFGLRPAEELYDLRSDPHQMHNVASDAAYQNTRQELSERLMKVLHETGDPRVIGDGTTFDKLPYTISGDADEKAAPKKKRAKKKEA